MAKRKEEGRAGRGDSVNSSKRSKKKRPQVREYVNDPWEGGENLMEASLLLYNIREAETRERRKNDS